MNNSFTFTKENLISLSKSLAIVSVGAVLTYLTQWAANTDFGQYNAIVMGIMSLLTNAVRLFVSNK